MLESRPAFDTQPACYVANPSWPGAALTWNCCRLGRPPGRSAGAKQVVQLAQAAGSSEQGGWSGGGQCVPFVNSRQHCGRDRGGAGREAGGRGSASPEVPYSRPAAYIHNTPPPPRRHACGISGEDQVRKSSSQEAAGVASQEAQGARAAAATREPSESGSQPAMEHTRETSGEAALTFRPSTTNMTGGPTLRGLGGGRQVRAGWAGRRGEHGAALQGHSEGHAPAPAWLT